MKSSESRRATLTSATGGEGRPVTDIGCRRFAVGCRLSAVCSPTALAVSALHSALSGALSLASLLSVGRTDVRSSSAWQQHKHKFPTTRHSAGHVERAI